MVSQITLINTWCQRDAFLDSDYIVSSKSETELTIYSLAIHLVLRLFTAFGITSYDSNPEPIEDPSYGILKAYYKSWGIKKGVQGVDF